MINHREILFILIFLLARLVHAQTDLQKDQIEREIQKFGQIELQFAYPGFDELNRIGRLISVSDVKDGMVSCIISNNDIDDFLSLNMEYKIVYSDQSKTVISALSVEEAMNWDVYPSYQQYDTIMHKFAEDYPSICKIDTIGESVEGRHIFALKISDNVESDEVEPEVFYSSTMHGDELAGYVLMLQLAEHILVNAENGGLEQELVDSLEIWINPLANPDGTYNNGDTISSPTRSNANGTDLNRNFPDPLYPSITPDTENIAMIDFMRGRNFVLSANFHSGAEVVNFPWDRWLSKIHADSMWFYQISRCYADTVHNYSVPTYMDSYNNGVVRGAVWYIIYGGRQDFVTYELQGREVTIEIDNTKQTAGAQLPLLWENNYRSLLRYLENAFYGIHGLVIDENSGLPVEAEIYIEGHDVDSSQIFSSGEDGSFIRLIEAGTWTLTVLAEGYDTKIVTNIELADKEQKFITIRMSPLSSGINFMHDNYRLKIWPVPSTDIIYMQNNSITDNNYRVQVFNQTGTLMMDIQAKRPSGEILDLDISSLMQGYYILRVFSGESYCFNGSFVKD